VWIGPSWGWSNPWWGPTWWGNPAWGPSWTWGSTWWGPSSAWGTAWSPAWTWSGQQWDGTVGIDATTFVERPAVVVQSEGGAWYYCVDPPGYFPHVARCNRPWVVVNPSDVAGAAPNPR